VHYLLNSSDGGFFPSFISCVPSCRCNRLDWADTIPIIHCGGHTHMHNLQAQFLTIHAHESGFGVSDAQTNLDIGLPSGCDRRSSGK